MGDCKVHFDGVGQECLHRAVYLLLGLGGDFELGSNRLKNLLFEKLLGVPELLVDLIVEDLLKEPSIGVLLAVRLQRFHDRAGLLLAQLLQAIPFAQESVHVLRDRLRRLTLCELALIVLLLRLKNLVQYFLQNLE